MKKMLDEKKIETKSSLFQIDSHDKDLKLDTFQPINIDLNENSINTDNEIKNRNIINIISIILIIISSIFLFKSYKPFEEKLNYSFEDFIKEVGKDIIISGFFFSFIPIFIIEELIHKIFIIILCLYYGIIFYFNKGNTSKEHGIFNNIGFFLVVCYFSIIYFCLIWIFKKLSNNIIKILYCIFSISIIIFLFYILIQTYYNNFTTKFETEIIIIQKEIDYNDKNKTKEKIIDPKKECLKWGYGLGGKRLENKEESLKNKNSCYMRFPNKCYRFIYDNIFDFSKKENINCPNLNINSRQKLINTLQKYNNYDFSSTYNFGYPKTNIITSDNDRTKPYFGKIVLKRIYDLDKADNDNKNPEISVSFDKEGKGTVKINIERNEKLIKEKSEKYKKRKNNIRYENIYIIYIDALGREQFYRKLPKTRQLLENYYWDNKQKIKKATSFQFFKYQNFAGWTDINSTPMFQGTKFMETGYNIVHYYNERGYITAQAGGDCNRNLFGIFYWNVHTLKGLEFDHELISLFCDPNFIDIEDQTSDKNEYFGPYSPIRNCLYGKDAFEYIFEYAKQFIEKYIDQPKFMRIFFEDAHEVTQEKIKYMDDSLSNFIQYLIDNYYKEKYLIFFVSDHGNTIYNFGQKFIADDGIIERPIGVLFLIYNDNDNYYNKSGLIANEQKFITPYDVFMTMLLNFNDIDESVKNKKGQELDIAIDGMKRNCYTYDDYNVKKEKTERYCMCINF